MLLAEQASFARIGKRYLSRESNMEQQSVQIPQSFLAAYGRTQLQLEAAQEQIRQLERQNQALAKELQESLKKASDLMPNAKELAPDGEALPA